MEGSVERHGQEAWKAPLPERRRLVVDSQKGKAGWEKAEPAMDDTIDGDGMREAMAELRHQAEARAAIAMPSVATTELARLGDLRSRLAEAQRAVETAPAWKKLAGLFFERAEVSEKKRLAETLANDVRTQEILVRDLENVPKDRDIDDILAAARGTDSLLNPSLPSEFAMVARAIGAKNLFGPRNLPMASADRERAGSVLRKAIGGGNKVQAAWARAGLRLLDGYAASHPTREDVSSRVSAARAAEFLRTGPMAYDEATKRFVRVPGGDFKKSAEPTVEIIDDEDEGEELFSK